MNLTRYSIKRPIGISMIVSFFVVLGLYSYYLIGVELLPALNTPFVSISVKYPGANAESIEQQVIKPIEDALSAVSDVKKMTSMASYERARIMLELEFYANADSAAIDATKKVNAIRGNLPDEVEEPVVIKRDLNATPIVELAVTSDRPLADIYSKTDNTFQDIIQQASGVSEIELYGGRDREIAIEVDKDKMAAYKLTMADIVTALKNENQLLPSGSIYTDTKQSDVRVIAQYLKARDIEDIVVKNSDGIRIPFTAFATATEKEARVARYARFNGQDTVALRIYKNSDANIVETANNIVKQVEKLRREYKDYNFTIIRNDADYVNRSLHSTIGTLIEGLITTGLTLFVFLRGWQSTAAVMIAIPTSLISTFLIMYMAGFTFNMMSLMGMTLCIGILVDDSIVVLENIIRHLEMGEKPEEAAENGRNEIGMAAIAITLCDAAVFMPIAFMNSMTGQFFRQFGLTIVFAGMFSLFISFTLTPMLASQFFKNGYHITRRKLWDRMDAIENWAIETYDGVVRYSLANPSKILWPSLVLFVVSVAFIPLRIVGSEYMPQTDEGGFQVIVQLPVSSTADETNKVMKKLEDYVGDIPDVQYYLSNAGGRNSYEGRMRVQLYKRADRDQSIWQVTNGLRAYAQEIPNAVIRVMEDQSSISGVSSGGGVGSVGGMMQMELRGNDFDKLIAASDSVMKILKEDVKGTTDVNSSYIEGVPELQITADRERMKLFGVTLLDIQNAVKSSISGRDAGDLANDPLNDGQDTAIEVRFRDSDGYGMTDIANIPINAGGKIVYLSDVAQIANGTGPVMIRRVDKQRSIIIGCNLVGRPLNDVVQDTRAAISKIELGEGITYRFRGAATQMNDTFKELLTALLLALVLIYMLLAVLYESMITPFIRMFSLPLGIIGSILLLFLTHNTVNLYSLIGILVMDGIVAKNGTLLLDYTLTLMEEKGMSAYDAIIEAGRVRLKPIFMTTITMMIGMMPTAFAMTEGAETRSSMAWVIIGGLLTSTVFTLVVVPIIFLFFENNPPRTWWSLLKKGIGSLRDKLRSRLAPASQPQS